MTYNFPNKFLWGTATSAHQVEGNNTNNDWWEAEREGKISHVSGNACDSYNRYEEDFDVAKSFYNNAHRISIEWSRIEPSEGKFDKEEIEHYRKVIKALRERGLEPFVTLHHFTNPIWFSDLGGWASGDAPYYFNRYVEYVGKHLAREVRFWTTINEPLVVNSMGYLYGFWPPLKKRSLIQFIRATRNMVSAHKRAYHTLYSQNKDVQVGIVKNINYFDPAGNGMRRTLNRLLIIVSLYAKNSWFLNSIRNYQDFIGLNYYSRYRMDILRGTYHEGELKSDFGWEIYPEGIYHVLRSIKKYNKPIYITENGIADEGDTKRADYIKNHLRWIHKAIEEGVDVRGYFYWSLLDNFEWAEGFTKRFGLVSVNFQTQERKVRHSATIYKEICKSNSLQL